MFWVLWVSQAISTKIDSISIDSISVGKFDVYLHAKQLTSSTFNFHLILTNQLSWDITKILANLLFQVIWAGLAIIADNTDVYFNATNSNLTLASFLRYCWSIANLLFWVLWACLTTLTKNNINFGRYSTQECVLTMVETCKKVKDWKRNTVHCLLTFSRLLTVWALNPWTWVWDTKTSLILWLLSLDFWQNSILSYRQHN